MPTYERLLAARNALYDTDVELVATSLPLGFSVGFEVSISFLHSGSGVVTVGPGVCNVDGKQVTQIGERVIEAKSWVVDPGAESQYYIYLRQDGFFEVDVTAPVVPKSGDRYHSYHPITRARFIGRIYRDGSSEQVFATTGTKSASEVLVGSSEWIDDADYLCDGTSDEVDINSAIKYLSSAFGGGIVRLSPGTFNLSSDIRMLGSITLEGSGYGTRIVPRSTNDDQRHGIYILGTTNNTIDGCVIRNLRVQRSEKNAAYGSLTDVNGTAPKEILAEHADNLIIENNWIIDAPYEGIVVSGSKDFLVSGNVIQDTHVVSGTSPSQSIFLGNVDGAHELFGRVVNNQVYNTAVTAASLVGIVMKSPGKVLIANNVVRNFLCNSTDSVIGIYVRGSACTVSGNLLSDFRNSHDDTNGCWAIQVRDAPNCHVVGNTIRDIHGFPNTDTNQAGTGIYLTRESSVVPNDAHIASNFIHGCDQGIFIEDAGTDIYRVMLSGNQVYDCGQLIFHGHCESDLSANAPILLADAAAAGPTLYNATWARSDEQAYEGSYSYKITKGATGGDNANAYIHDGSGTSDMHGLVAGTEYTFEAWVYVPTSGGCAVGEAQIMIGSYVSDWNSYSSDTATSESSNQWEKLSATYTMPLATTGVRVNIRMDAAAATGEYFYVDSIRLYPTKNQNAHENLLKDEGTDTRF